MNGCFCIAIRGGYGKARHAAGLCIHFNVVILASDFDGVDARGF